MERKQLEALRKQYMPGCRIILLHMADDPQPIPDGTQGTVDSVDDAGQIHCKFDNGRCLAVLPGVDSFELITGTGHSRIVEDLKFAARVLRGLRIGTPMDELLRGHSAELHCAIHTLNRLIWQERHPRKENVK